MGNIEGGYKVLTLLCLNEEVKKSRIAATLQKGDRKREKK